jgi:hypothetical protein
VGFETLPKELRKRLRASAQVIAEYLAHTKPGARSGDLFEMAKKRYADKGYPAKSRSITWAAPSVTPSAS